MRTKTILLALATVAFSLVMVNPAWANYPIIAASAVCDPATGTVVINYTSTSWNDYDIYGLNDHIDILFNNVWVDSGAFTDANGRTFSGTKPAPVGTSVVVTAFAAGLWGGTVQGGQSDSITMILPSADCGQQSGGTGRFTGGGQQVRLGAARFNKGLTVHCDLLLSNNLEVNWQGNNFHMTEHLLTVECSDNPNIHQEPPVAPLDTLKGWGTGRFNGEDGYSIVFTLVDAGEPGTNDRAAILIYKGTTYNPVCETTTKVLCIPENYVDSGNLQAHYDQPHK